MKMSYIMVKPEGQRYLSEIESMILNEGFCVESIYHVDDWEKVSCKVYEKCLNERGEKYKQEFLAHVWLNKYLFGNEAIVIFLSKPNIYGINLLGEIMNVKKKIRNRYNATKDGTFMIALDFNKIGLKLKIVYHISLC